MAKLTKIKTQENAASVSDFIASIESDQQRVDSAKIVELMEKVSSEKPKMWGKSMIGFGKMIYTSPATGRQVEWFKIGFSARKSNLSLHFAIDIKKHAEALAKLGKHKTGAGCLYINKLEDVDVKVLEGLMKEAMKKKA